ncbi:MAG: trypsin-like peptidase domain-containing protein [Planctomycetota bacterium]
MLGTAFRALLAGLVISGLAITLAVIFDSQRQPPDEPPPPPRTRASRDIAAFSGKPRDERQRTQGDISGDSPVADDNRQSAVTPKNGAAGGGSTSSGELAKGQSPSGQSPSGQSPSGQSRSGQFPHSESSKTRSVDSSTANGAPQRGKTASTAEDRPTAAPATGPTADTANASLGAASAKDRAASQGDNAPLLDASLVERLEESIVKIEAGGEGESEGVGAGFVIDARGWIATNYHVLADATTARARFKNGAAYEITGYAAIDPELDLAIVGLKEPPRELLALPLADEGDPRRLAPVLAIGHPRGVEFSLFDGKVSRVLATSELPRGSQRFVRQLISGSADHRWIQHTAKLSEGNSGGPLLDAAGAVVGINTWVDRQAAFSYSLHVRHLRELRDAVAGPIEPLRDYARKEARVNDLLARLTPAVIEEWLARAESIRWSPESERDYEVLQQLAWAVTVVKLPDTLAGGRLEERLDPLLRAARKVEQRLANLKWDAAGQVTLINELALGQVARPMAGVFLFGVVERTVEGDAGERGALVKLAGADQMLFLPLDGQLVVPAPGLQCLILGVNYDGHRIRYGDNPLKLITAHVIASRTLLPLEKPAE